jgi:hypothetical protein
MVTAMLLPRQGELEENSAAREDCQRTLRDLIRFARRTDREWSRMDKQNSWVYRVRKSRVWFTGPGDDTGMYSRYTFTAYAAMNTRIALPTTSRTCSGEGAGAA